MEFWDDIAEVHSICVEPQRFREVGHARAKLFVPLAGNVVQEKNRSVFGVPEGGQYNVVHVHISDINISVMLR